MGITRAQIARQLLAEGGMPMKEIKGQDHMLAYITPNEADKLVKLGGQETMTPEGIPAYPEYDNYGYSNQADFDQGNYSKSNDPTVSGYADRNMSDDDLKALSYAVKPAPKKTFAQKVVDSIKNVSNSTPFGIARKGLGSLFNKFGTFAQNMRGGLTQKQFEDARRERQRQNRISNIMGRDAPFTEMTLENLRNLGFTGPLEGLIGSTNVTRSATPDDVYPDRVEGIVSQAPEEYRFTDAMANLNLDRGSATRNTLANNFNILDFAVPGHSKVMYEGKDSIVSNAPSVKDYHIAANADLSRRISNQLKDIPRVGEVASLGYDVFAPAASYPVSMGYDLKSAYDRMEPGSGIKGFYDAFMDENPFSAAAYRAAGAAAPLAERIKGT